MKKLLTLGPVLFLLGLAGIGCSNTVEGAKEDMNKDAPVVRKDVENAAAATERAAHNAGQVISEGAKDAADKTHNAAKNTTAALEVTPRVKTAIVADSQLNDTRNLINVDSANNIVHLKGHVVSKQMKQRAGKIAQKTLAQGHSTDKLSNELKVQN